MIEFIQIYLKKILNLLLIPPNNNNNNCTFRKIKNNNQFEQK